MDIYHGISMFFNCKVPQSLDIHYGITMVLSHGIIVLHIQMVHFGHHSISIGFWKYHAPLI